MAKSIYVGNLSYEVTEADLKHNFETIGQCVSVKIITDKYTGQSRGFAFVEMSNDREAQEAIKRFNSAELCGRTLTVKEAKPRAERGPGGGRPGGSGGFRGQKRF